MRITKKGNIGQPTLKYPSLGPIIELLPDEPHLWLTWGSILKRFKLQNRADGPPILFPQSQAQHLVCFLLLTMTCIVHGNP